MKNKYVFEMHLFHANDTTNTFTYVCTKYKYPAVVLYYTKSWYT